MSTHYGPAVRLVDGRLQIPDDLTPGHAHDLRSALDEWITQQCQAPPMSWSPSLEAYRRSDRGYLIFRSGSSTFLSYRTAGEPVPGLNVHSTLDWAQQCCDRDWQERVAQDPRLLAAAVQA